MSMSFKMVRNLGLSTMAIIVVGIGLISFDTTGRITRSISEITEKDRPKLQSADNIRQNFIDAKDVFIAFTREEEKDITPAVVSINKVIKESNALVKIVEEEDKEEVAKFVTAAKRFKAAVVTYAEEFEYDPTGDAAINMEKTAIAAAKEANETATKMVKKIRARIEAADMNMLVVIKRNRKVTATSISIAIIIAFLLTFFINYALAKPIRQLVDGTQRIAKGDLHFRVTVESRDELGQLAASFNKMTEDLNISMEKEKELAAAVAVAEIEKKRSAELEKAYKELRNTQEMLIQSEKLSALGQIGAGITHELNSPLAGVLSLIRSYMEEKNPKTEEYQDLKEMKEACEHMSKIIKDFYSFSRLSADEVAELNCNEVLESTLSFSGLQLTKKGIRIEKSYDKKLPLVKGDKNQIQQVIINMITNARDAMEMGGVFKIATRANNSDKGSFVEMEFSDTGSGISKENIRKIFDPFFTTKRPGGGTGLGLSITHTIVKNHKGEILVNSNPGGGTTFTVRLPVISSSG